MALNTYKRYSGLALNGRGSQERSMPTQRPIIGKAASGLRKKRPIGDSSSRTFLGGKARKGNVYDRFVKS